MSRSAPLAIAERCGRDEGAGRMRHKNVACGSLGGMPTVTDLLAIGRRGKA